MDTAHCSISFVACISSGGFQTEVGGGYISSWSVVFVDNDADGLGGAMLIVQADLLEVSGVLFQSNQASLGGAVYVTAVDNKHTLFNACVFERNRATDGGAVYLNTGPGFDIFISSVFRSNFAGSMGGAIFHTGELHLFHTTFVANEVGHEGAAILSIGFLEELSNVSFSGNTYFCRAGEYGYIDTDEGQIDFFTSSFDEVCARCSAGRDSVDDSYAVRIDGIPVCAEPPPGVTADLGGTTVATLTLDKGYFRTSNESHEIMKCYQESACRGGSDANQYCSSGYTGPYCAVCAEGFAPGIAYSCRQCSGGITRSAVALAVAFGLSVLLSGAVVVSHLGSVVDDRAEENMEAVQSSWKQKCSSCRTSLVAILPLTAIKIVVTVWQIISQFDAIAGDVYPELYKTFISKLNLVNLDLDFAFSYSCLVANDFYHRLVFATILPLLVLVVLAASYLIGKKRNSCSESAMRDVRHKHQAAVLYVAFFVYSPVSYRIFQTFGCDELDDGTAYLRADYGISCLTSRHSWYKVYALIMVGVYPVGIALVFAWLLFGNRGDLVKPDRETVGHLKPLHGIWAAYKPSRYYYEVVECIRRIALTGIATFVLPNSTAQISIAFLFAVVFVFISEALAPFERGVDMGLYRWGNCIIVASMFVALLMKVNVGQENTQYLLTFSGVLLAANVFMVVAVLLQTALLVKELRRLKAPVRLVDTPIRRDRSASVRPVGRP